jgi:hypothetical protein
VKTVLAVFLLCIAMCTSAFPLTDKVTQWGYITQLRAGVVEDSMAVFLKVPFAGDAACIKDDGYETDPADAGHKLFNATLLGAYFNSKQVQLVLRGCGAYSKPHIVAVYVKD